MKLNVINDSGIDFPEDLLNKWIKGIAAELLKKKIINSERKAQEVSLVFLSENDAKKLNWNYRCKDYPTDILSFASDDPTSMGELVICPQVLSRQAKDHDVTLEDELGYIVLHGILHLLGYDHEKNKAEEEKMMSLQNEIFENLRNPKSIKKEKTVAENKAPLPKKRQAAGTKTKTHKSVKKADTKSKIVKKNSKFKTKQKRK